MALSDIVSPEESLGRYLPEETYFSRTKNTVRPKAFMPASDLRLSVFRIDGLEWEEIWEIGQREVIDAMQQSKELYGVAETKVWKIHQTTLEVDPDKNPSRHANIVGWPQEKPKQKLIAEELAAEADLILR